MINEYVYEKNTSSGSYEKLSELNWHMEPVYCAGAALSLQYKRFLFKPVFSAAIPAPAGLLEDSDWIYTSSTGHSVKSRYSESDSITTAGYSFSLDFSFDVSPLHCLKIYPLAGIDYSYLKFSAKNLDEWYSEAGISYTKAAKKSLYQNQVVINYSFTDISAWLGLSLVYSPFSFLDLEADARFAPYTWIDAMDEHVIRNTNFFDNTYGFFKAQKYSAKITYKPLKHFYTALSFSFYNLNELKSGNSYENYKTTNDSCFIIATKPGFSQKYYEFGLSLTYRPF